MRGHLLRDLQSAAVLEIGRDAGSPEGVALIAIWVLVHFW
jgi:hypothetical protein